MQNSHWNENLSVEKNEVIPNCSSFKNRKLKQDISQLKVREKRKDISKGSA